MNKKMNKKGFTIVELVIVIAVIAILAAVMIPTFGGIIETAQESGEMQKVTAAYKEAYAIAISNDGVVTDADFPETGLVAGGFTFKLDANKNWTVTAGGNSEFTYSFDGSKWTVSKKPANT